MSVKHDGERSKMTGLPEVLLAEPKTLAELEESIAKTIKSNHKILITRIRPDQHSTVDKMAKQFQMSFKYDQYKRTSYFFKNDILISNQPEIAIISGGTSDGSVVEEIRFTLEFFEKSAKIYQDVGVAGIHRHKKVLEELKHLSLIKLLIVVAGNEGALFSVISAQTHLPVLAVPTSIGYGFGGKGLAALQSALQSCSPGIAVFNIDNGFGAASFALKMLLQFTRHDE